MEMASGKWLSELEMEEPTPFPQLYQMMNPIDYSFHDLDFQSLSSENYACNPYINGSSFVQASHEMEKDFERPVKQLKASSWNSCTTENHIPPPPKPSSSSSSHIISFDNSNSSSARQFYDVKHKTAQVSRSRTPIHAQDHVIAERKRREKLSQSFISLQGLIPGLKKTDKASVLGEAIKYLKQLKDRVAVLEKQVSNKPMESVIFVRKTQIYADEETISSSVENFPEMEARVSDKDVLIRILCKNNKGCIPNIINEVEKLHLFVLNTSVLPFGQDTLDITIVAQMEGEFSITVKDLVTSLRLALLKFVT